MAKPEARARETIDDLLVEAGWIVQDREEMNLYAGRGVAVREFRLRSGHGFVDYLLFVDRKATGVLEAKPQGHTLKGVEPQGEKYSQGLPDDLDPAVRPLPFIYLSTGAETVFWNRLDPEPRSRTLRQFHRPETHAEWATADPIDRWKGSWSSEPWIAEPPEFGRLGVRPSSLRSRLQEMPPVDPTGLWPNQLRAIEGLEKSLKEDRPRALLQMATGSGKTFTAVSSIYRLIKYGGARRVLFLVDRKNLGEQAEAEFAGFETPDEHRKLTELYNVQHLTSNRIASSAKVVITTIQRLYSMLKGEEDLDPAVEEGSQFNLSGDRLRQPVPVVYNPAIPIEYFDVVFVDECHRSIYSLWRQVLDYFDAYLIGLTATPAKHTFGFFRRNLVMEYGHEEAVADGVNVDFELYQIRTRITEGGSTIEAGPQTVVEVRDRKTRFRRWQQPDEDITYGPGDLDRSVVARDQIRLVVRTFKERLFTEIFPGRREVPKTLIFAKDDSHAEDIVGIVREEFGKGNDFCQKITYKVTERKPKDLIQDFRNSYNPRIAVTVDMIATGTDVRPIEIVLFLRSVKSRVYFEQMKGRGVRVIDREALQAVTPDARDKTHFVIVDCVGIIDGDLADTQPLERKKSISFKALLEHVAAGGTDPEILSSLASRLARLDRQCGPSERDRIAEAADGLTLPELTRGILGALDPDRIRDAARERFGLAPETEPSEDQLESARIDLSREAVKPLAAAPTLRGLLIELKEHFEQILDEVSIDELARAGFSPQAREKARGLVDSFERYLEEHRDEIEALEFFYSQPHARRLRYADIKALAEAIGAPPRNWTPEKLWRAYETLDRSRVRGSAQRVLTDLVSLVRFALHRDEELAPYPEQVQRRFDRWMAQQETAGREFGAQQRRWLEMIRDHIATSLEMEVDDFAYTPFVEQGGLGKAREVFGAGLVEILRELNEELAA